MDKASRYQDGDRHRCPHWRVLISYSGRSARCSSVRIRAPSRLFRKTNGQVQEGCGLPRVSDRPWGTTRESGVSAKQFLEVFFCAADGYATSCCVSVECKLFPCGNPIGNP